MAVGGGTMECCHHGHGAPVGSGVTVCGHGAPAPVFSMVTVQWLLSKLQPQQLPVHLHPKTFLTHWQLFKQKQVSDTL